jgi:hypothetical protein
LYFPHRRIVFALNPASLILGFPRYLSLQWKEEHPEPHERHDAQRAEEGQRQCPLDRPCTFSPHTINSTGFGGFGKTE